MAYSDFSRFMPLESAYRNPGEATEAYRAQALEKANVQSELERFYKTLEETQRQFDETLGFKESELAETTRQFDETLGQREYEFDTTTSETARMFDETMTERQDEFAKEMDLKNRYFGLDEAKFIFSKHFDGGGDSSLGWANFGGNVAGFGAGGGFNDLFSNMGSLFG